jgi:hypothetical protein
VRVRNVVLLVGFFLIQVPSIACAQCTSLLDHEDVVIPTGTVSCAGTGQLCDPPLALCVDTAGPVGLLFTVSPLACGPGYYHVGIDGQEIGKPLLGWPDATGDFAALPLQALVEVLASAGTHTITIQPEGVVGGCNSGRVFQWEGTVEFNPSNNLAQCQFDLGVCRADPLLQDADGDGRPDVLDLCPDTPPGIEVDANGCSVAQFCGGVDATTIMGRTICRHSDWKNDEPLMKGSQRDCMVHRDAAGDRCVPTS